MSALFGLSGSVLYVKRNTAKRRRFRPGENSGVEGEKKRIRKKRKAERKKRDRRLQPFGPFREKRVDIADTTYRLCIFATSLRNVSPISRPDCRAASLMTFRMSSSSMFRS